MISDAYYRMLVWIRRQNVDGITVTDDAILDSEHHYMRTQKLCDAGLLARAVLVNPGMEKEYPDGLYHYYVTVDGLDAIALYEQALKEKSEKHARQERKKYEQEIKRKKARRKKLRDQCLIAIFTGLLGLFLNLIEQHPFEFYEMLKRVLGK